MGDICLNSENWDDLCGMVKAAGIDLETLAQETRAIRRRRAVRDAETLLRLGLAYGGGLGSFRTVSAWAAQAGLAHLSKVALMKRLAKAADLLIAIAGRLLLAGCKARVPDSIGSRQLRLVDASCIQSRAARGPTGACMPCSIRPGSVSSISISAMPKAQKASNALRSNPANPDRRPRLSFVSRLAPCPPWRR